MNNGWSSVDLGDLVAPGRAIAYGVLKPGDEDRSGVPLVRATDLRGGRVLVGQLRTITSELSAQYKRTILHGGELLMSLVGNPGEVAIVPNSLKGANVNRATGVIPLGETVCARYLLYYFRSPEGRNQVKSLCTGSVQVVVNLGDLRRLSVRLPSLEQQRVVSGILGDLDDLIENNRRRVELLEEMARLIYREWFVHFRYPGHEEVPLVDSELGPIPEGWDVVRLDVACDFREGKSIKKESRGGGETLVYGANGVIGATSLEARSGPCTVMGKIGSCGALHRARTDCWITNNAFSVHPGRWVSPEMVWFGLGEIDFNPLVGGAANPYLPVKSFGHLPVACPPKQLALEFEELAGGIGAEIHALMDLTASLVSLRDLLLPGLVSGRIDVSDLDLDLPEEGAA